MNKIVVSIIVLLIGLIAYYSSFLVEKVAQEEKKYLNSFNKVEKNMAINSLPKEETSVKVIEKASIEEVPEEKALQEEEPEEVVAEEDNSTEEVLDEESYAEVINKQEELLDEILGDDGRHQKEIPLLGADREKLEKEKNVSE